MDKKQYSILVITMREMYKDKQITVAQVKSAYNKKYINIDEYNYVLKGENQ